MERLKLKINLLTKKEIEHYCQSVEDILIKINNRSNLKKIMPKESKQAPDKN
jgi:hypothetical protein